MPRRDGPRPRRLARLAAVLSWRTISGRLIISLIVLFGLAAVVVSLVTASSLSNTLMSSLDNQLQGATQRWQNCVTMPDDDDGNHADAAMKSSPPPGGYCPGQGQGTFEAELSYGGTFDSTSLVPRRCYLTAADEKTLQGLPTTKMPASTPGGQGDPDAQPSPDVPTYTVTLYSLDGEYKVTKVQVGNQVLITGLSLKTTNASIAHVEDTEHEVFGIVLLLAIVVGAAMVELSLRPLRRVAATATQVTQLPLDAGEVSLPAGVPDTDPRTEAGRVGAAFNRMLYHVERALGRRAASEARLRRFAADASHELRTPLSAIRGYAELGLRHPGPVPDEVRYALSRVQSESERMSVLVEDLLLLARLDAGRPLEREPVDLSRLAIETTSDAQVARGDHRWRLDLPDEPVLVEGDEHRLHQVLANLLSNAGKHTPPDSTVTVALVTSPAPIPVLTAPVDAASIQRGTPPTGPQVKVSVTDDGPGIPSELLPELFERFTRADTSRARDIKAAGKSTGLGLAIVDAVVAAHGGCIAVTSRPGLTRFAIILPLLPASADLPESSTAEP